ncbi:hypothetical protein [Nocardioides sp. SYSU D00038]|uniref:hypothetical protein n=1 Tax=Nocardioides sp. SYSU D00038 TaxID=2812554 RepID=UPI001967101E|nr:hypothetical protein [Nocardioides sp. SYSU D00038]
MTLAPPAPGRLGEALQPAAVQAYLGELDAWVRARRSELDELDAAALASGRAGEITSDMALSLALWKAVSDRYQLLWATWDGGRVLQTERERLSVLIWGRLDGAMDPAVVAKAAVPGVAFSLPEACRLSDALVGQLRTRLALVPGADASAARIKELRAQLERLRDQVALEPAGSRDAADATRAALATRLADVTARAQRGADVGGLLGPLEVDAATFERDLIVGNARRRDARDQIVAAQEFRADLEARAAALTTLARTCVETVDPAPTKAVPDLTALGPVPNTASAIGPYRARLDRVAQALTIAQDEYAAALAGRADLLALLDGYAAKARALGVADHPDVAASEQQARAVLARTPTPMVVARQLVATYQTWVEQALASRGRDDQPGDSPSNKETA